MISSSLLKFATDYSNMSVQNSRSDSMTAARDALIGTHLVFARMLAGRFRKHLPDCVDIEELESDACFGLLQAANAFDADRGVLFRSYATRRILGAMLDGLRERNGVRSGQIVPQFQSIDAEVTDTEGNTISYAESLPDDSEPVGDRLEMRDEAEFVMRHLKPDSRELLIQQCIEGLQQQEIAAKRGVTASAVSQRTRQVRQRLKEIRCRLGR